MAKYLNEQPGEYQLFYNNLMFKSFKSYKSYKNEIFVRFIFVRFGTFKRLEHKVIVK